MSEGPTPLSTELTEVDPLRAAAPVDGDLEARQARASVAAGLFGDSSEDTPPPRVGRYEVVEKIGAGGMGVVYRARDPELDRAVALKLLRPDTADDETARKRMVREARALARLSHPNVVQVYDVGTRGDEVFVAMEFIDGQDLAAWLKDEDRRWEDTLELFLEAAKGLAAAHDEGLVHRDFKPANVLVGNDGRVVVVDFGLARPVDPMALPLMEGATTHVGALVGTPMYMAPEQFEGGHADARTDQFAFCVALYHSLYGARPFAGDNVAAYVSNVIHGRIVDADAATKIPVGVAAVLRRGLALKPQERHADMRTLAKSLQTAAAGSSSRPKAKAAASAAPPSPPAWLWPVAILFVAVLAGWYFVAGSGGVEPAPLPVPAEPVSDVIAAKIDSDNPAASGEESGTFGVERAEQLVGTRAGSERTSSSEGLDSGTADEGEADSPSPEPVLRNPPVRGDWCAFHEDNYSLIRRVPKRRSSFEKDGTCYTCRVERRRQRIARLHPSDCGGYQLCSAKACE